MKKSNKFFKKGVSMLLAMTTFFTSVFSGVGITEVQAGTETIYSEKPADGSDVYLYNDGHISYGGYGTHYFKTSEDSGKDFSWYGYCADPVGGTPATGYYEVDYDIENYTVSVAGFSGGESSVERVVYQLYGQPGSSRLETVVTNVLGSTDWTGSAWDDESLYVISHLIASTLFGGVTESFYGTDTSFTSWFEDKYDSMGGSGVSSSNKLYGVMCTLIYQLSMLSPSQVDSDFDVYILKTQNVSSSYQLILGVYYPQTGTVTTQEYGYIKITKTSSESSSYSLSGAEYGVYSDSSCSDLECTITIGSDNTGTARVSLGTASSKTFYVKEVTAPTGYMKSTDVKSVTVTANNTSSVPASVTMTEDIIEGDVKVEKTDSETLTATAQGDGDLSGAVFTIYNDSGHSLIVNGTTVADGGKVTTITTNSSGIATTGSGGALPYGKYIIKETTAPTGYKLDSTEYSFSITSDGQVKTVDVSEEIKHGGVTVTKVDSDTLKATAQGDGDLSGAVFTIYNASDHAVVVNGTKYAVGKAVMTITTDSSGVAKTSTSALPYGTYTVKETTAPEGYLLSDTEYTFSITADGQMKSVTADDEIKRGGVTVTKVDSDTLKATAQGDGDLSGAVFTIYNASEHSVVVNGTTYAVGKAVMTITTDSSGVAKTSTSALPYGTYTVKETTAPEGYLLSDTEYTFSITADGQMKSVTADNEIKRGGVKITKVDSETLQATAQGDGDLSGAEFTIYNASDHAVVVNGTSYAVGKAVMTVATGSDGTVTIDSSALPYGTYTVKETKAPTGYLLSDEEYTFTIRKDEETKSITADNDVIRGGVEIYKRDYETNLTTAQGDATLSGAAFAIINNSDAAVIVNGVSYAVGETVLTLTTDENGYATTDTDGDGEDDTLPYGTYIIKETSAPTGYLGEGVTQRTFTIREDGVVVDMTAADSSIRNEVIRGGVKIYKYDYETNQTTAQGDATLSGATFEIINNSKNAVVVNGVSYEPGETVLTLTTDSKGYASTSSDALPYGSYIIKETGVPTGYLGEGVLQRSFTIREDGVVVDMTDVSKSIRNKVIRGGVSIYKMDEDLVDLTGADEAIGVAQGDATLAGATYVIVNKSTHAVLVNNVLYDPGEVVYTLVTDENGYATTDTDGDGVDYTLPYGTYDIYEVEETDYGYLLNEDDVNTIKIRTNGEVIVLDGGEVVDTVKRQAFQIVKISADTAATEVYGVEDAEFTIYNVSDSVVTLGNNVYQTGTESHNNGTSTVNGTTYYLGDAVETITTDSTGYACSSRLSYGTYVVRETKTPTDLNTVEDFVVVIREESTEPQVWRYFNDSPFTAYIKAVKEDAKTGKTVLIEGVTFKIINSDTGEYVTQKVGDQYIDTFYTNENGYTVTPLKLECGNYELVEITAPYGYTVKDETIAFTVSTNTMYKVDQDNDAVITVECVNDEVTGSVTVYKHGEALTGITTDENGNIDFTYKDEPLPGSTFIVVTDEDIYTPDMQKNDDGTRTIATYNGVECYKGAVVAAITSGSNGYVTVDGLPLGSYHIEEVGVTEGYTISTYVDSFTLTYKDQDTAVIYYSDADYENARVTTELELTKTGLKSGEAIEGAVYGLYAAENIVSYFGEVLVKKGTLIETRTTNADGHISWTADLPLYSYYVQEIEAAEGTLYNDEVYNVDLSYQGADVAVVKASVYAVNDETELDVLKIDAETGEGLAGAVLQLLDEEGSVVDEWTTDGTAHKIYRLAPGYYTVHEVSAPVGYVTFSDVTVKVLLTSEIQEIRIADKQTEIHVSKVEATGGEELPGAILQIIDEDGTVLYEWTSTDEEYVIKKIPVGTYILHEDYTPLGYATAQDVTFTVLDTGEIQSVEMIDEIITVSISKEDATTGEELEGAELTLYDSEGNMVESWTSTDEAHIITGLLVGETYTLHEDLAPLGYATAQDVSFTIEDTGDVQEVVMVDEIITVSIFKKEATNNEELAGAELTLYDSEGNVVESWTSTEEEHIITGLHVGETYTLHEDLAPLGYATASDVTFTISDTGEVQEVIMVDEIITVSISKQDATTGEELPGATLQVIDSEGNIVDEWTSTDEAHIITGLHVGETYTLHEDLAPLGYATASDVTFTISDTGEVQEVIMVDEIITVSISKKDATAGEELPGAQLTLYDEDGNEVESWISTDEPNVITGLHVGETYTLHEDLAPLGYATASDVIFTISDTGEVQEVEMVDEIITVSISKQDATTGEELPGAELTLYDEDGNIVDQWTSTNEPHIITGLHVGETYTLHEDCAPAGYNTASDVTFTISDTGEVQRVVMYDEVIPTTTTSIPKTSDAGFGGVAAALMLAIIGTGCIGAAGKKKKNGKKESKCM